MTDSIPIDNLIASVSCSQADWEQTPSVVQTHLVTLHTNLHTLDNQLPQLGQQVDQLQSRMAQTSTTSSKPPSSDSPFTTWKPRPSLRKRGGHKGRPGDGPKPGPTHQVLELPPIDMEVMPPKIHNLRQSRRIEGQ